MEIETVKESLIWAFANNWASYGLRKDIASHNAPPSDSGEMLRADIERMAKSVAMGMTNA